MQENNWGIMDLSFKESSVKGFSWLSHNQLNQLKNLFNYAGLLNVLNGAISNQNAVEFTASGNNEASFTIQAIKFDTNTKVEIISSKDLPIFARLYTLKKQEHNVDLLRLIAIDDDKIIIDEEKTYEINILDNINIFESLKTIPSNEEEISTQAWYSNVPCVANGCCVFNEPAWPGGPLFPLYYNWCGASCGSGTPVNGTDTCCRTHDYCYGSFSTYPNRCSCDQTMMTCTAGKSGAAALAIYQAFKLKRAAMGC